jgi:hypothetical protein
MLLKGALNGKHIVLDSIKVSASESSLESVIFGIIEEIIEEMVSDEANVLLFSQNIVGLCIKSLICSSLYFLGTNYFDQQLEYITNQFYKLIRI